MKNIVKIVPLSLLIALFVALAAGGDSYAAGGNRSSRNSEDESFNRSRSSNDVSLAILALGNFSYSHQLISAPGSSTSTSTTPAFSTGLGLSFDFPITAGLSFEMGALYLQRQTLALETSEAYKTRWLQIAPQFKFWPVAGIISIGAGPSYSRKIGNTNPGFGLSPAIYNQDEVGAVVSLGLNMPLVRGLAFTTEGRYSLALTNTYNEKELARQLVVKGADAKDTIQTSFDQKHSEAQVLAGFRFEI